MERKLVSSRKPPAAAHGHEVVDEWLTELMPTVQSFVTAIDERICAAIPDLEFAIKWGKAYYGLPDLGWIIEVASYHRTANIVFLGGASFDDPPKLGSGSSRYVKLAPGDDLSSPELTRWLTEAATTPGWR